MVVVDVHKDTGDIVGNENEDETARIMKKNDDTIQELVNDEYEANAVIVNADIKDETGEYNLEEAGDNELKNYGQEAN